MRTEPFRVSRLALAYLAVARYLRAFGWFAAIVPLFGLASLIAFPGSLRAMGLMALLWPLSLPARAIVATSKAGRLLERGAWASLEDGALYLHARTPSGEPTGLRLGLDRVRRVERRWGFLVLVLPRGEFLALPLAGVGEPFAAAVEAGFADAQTRNNP